MSPNQQDNGQQSRSWREGSSASASGRDSSSKAKSDEWTDVQDPNERRKIQNKLAQRRFRKSVIFLLQLVSIEGTQHNPVTGQEDQVGVGPVEARDYCARSAWLFFLFDDDFCRERSFN
jgi:hypothetical protein